VPDELYPASGIVRGCGRSESHDRLSTDALNGGVTKNQ
jgi:hypothetical protein